MKFGKENNNKPIFIRHDIGKGKWEEETVTSL